MDLRISTQVNATGLDAPLFNGSMGASTQSGSGGGSTEPASWDALVASSGGDYTDPDSAIIASNCAVYVKPATYDTDITCDQAGQIVYFGPGTVIDDGASGNGTITVSADNVTLVFGPGCTVDGDLTINGSQCFITIGNGCTLARIIEGSAANETMIYGEGCGAISEGFSSDHDDAMAMFFGVNSKSPADGNNALGLSAGGLRQFLLGINVVDSDGDALAISEANATCIAISNQDCDTFAVDNNDEQALISGCNLISPGSNNGIDAASTADDSLYSGNVVRVSTGNPVELKSGANDSLVTNCRLDGSVVNSSTSSSVNRCKVTTI